MHSSASEASLLGPRGGIQGVEGLSMQELDGRHELEAMTAQPYEDDPDLAWDTDSGPSLPYDGEVPPEVLRLAERRAHNTERR